MKIIDRKTFFNRKTVSPRSYMCKHEQNQNYTLDVNLVLKISHILNNDCKYQSLNSSEFRTKKTVIQVFSSLRFV